MNNKLTIACFILAVAGGAALACGPGFPWQLLDDRQATMHTLPDNDFAFEAAHLVPVPADAPKLSTDKVSGNNVWQDSESEFPDDDTSIETGRDNAERIAAEAEELTPDQRSTVHAMRMATSDADAKTAGINLPADVQLYTLGARDFATKAYDIAIGDFQVAVTSVAKPTLHSIWAQFMLGRAQAAKGDEAAAHQAFVALRQSVAAGAPDPLNVAIASYGEEGRLAIERADAAKRAQAPNWQPARADALKQAVQLYALQAAIDPTQGVPSLLVMADEIMYDPADLDATVDDDVTRRLLTAYAVSRWSDRPHITLDAGYRTMGVFDRDLSKRQGKFDPVGYFLDILNLQKISTVAGLDRIAALAYRDGRYDLAAGFAVKSETPLAYWVRAKLAVRDGKREEAAAFYAKAVDGLAADPGALDKDFGRRLRGERAVLTLSHQDYLVALEQLYPDATTYWGDIAYLAERILTLEELKGFVDAHAGIISPAPAGQIEYAEDGGPAVSFSNPPVLLRELLGRRLMREGRAQEAVVYFSTKHKEEAQAYASSLAAIKKTHGIDRALALHEAAKQERENGLDLLGYEAGPDFVIYDGNFGWGLGQTSVYGSPYGTDQNKPKPSLTEAFSSQDESRRLVATTPVPNLRFHYRYVAAQHEAEAAKLVPQRSQAYAALLCTATQDVQSRNADIARTYYRQYTKYGAHVPWAIDFGNNCPAPDFDEAKGFHWQQFRKHLSKQRLHLAALAAGGVVLSGGLGATFIRRRRNKG